MKRSLLQVLPPGSSSMSHADADGEIVTACLTGPIGSASIVPGVPRFVPDEAYAGSFGRQWTHVAIPVGAVLRRLHIYQGGEAWFEVPVAVRGERPG